VFWDAHVIYGAAFEGRAYRLFVMAEGVARGAQQRHQRLVLGPLETGGEGEREREGNST